MGHALDDLAAHHIWATAELLTFCRGLDEAALAATTPGVYGTAIGTLRHLLDAEASYLFRLTGAWAARPWPEGEAVGLDVLAERAAILAGALNGYLAGDLIDTERLGEAWGDEGAVFDVRAGIFLTQIIHHANEHRAHVCSILGAHGHEPPELSAWAYALASGRMTLREGRVTTGA